MKASALAHELANIVLRSGTAARVVWIGELFPKTAERIRSEKRELVPYEDLSGELQEGDLVVVNDHLSRIDDLWQFLRNLRYGCSAPTRLIFFHTPWYYQTLLDTWASLRGSKEKPKSWLSHLDIENLLHLTGFEIVSYEDRLLCPWNVPLLAPILNRIVVKLPLFRLLGVQRAYFVRPRPQATVQQCSVSVIVPCRNERGNIRRILSETPVLGTTTELIFVEGGSRDGTREEIENQLSAYRGPLRTSLVVQEIANGKGGAVRLGFDAAQEDMLMILDADLTVPPSELEKFYLALAEGQGELIMGSRLVYPMEDQAMRTLNILGNKVFSFLFTWLLGRPIKDTLCGTKVLRKADYEKIRVNRHRFGFLDPFGDFDLIFGAAFQNFRIVEIPVRYKARTYGQTNISRFQHGWLLLRMCGIALRRLKLS